MKKLNEKRYLGLTVKYLESKRKRQTAIREALKEWLVKNNNVVNVPENYLNDFKFNVDGEEEQFKSIKYDGGSNEIYLANEDTLSQYAWAFAEEDQYVIDAVMNFYFNKPPMFDVSSDDDTDDYGVSEYLEGDADTRTGEIFDNYYGIERD